MPVNIFFSYADEDEALLRKLQTHLVPLQQEHLIDVWYDRDLSAGTEWMQEIDEHLNQAHIILLLVSQYSLNSDYFYSIEMQRALERHERREALVIPVILRPAYYQRTPFAKLEVLPTDGKPVVTWSDLNKAFLNITDGIRTVANELAQNSDVNRLVHTMQGANELPVRQVTSKHWQLGMRNRVGEYTMDIKDRGEWVSYGISLAPDVVGRNRASFYRRLLDISGRLNGSHIGVEGNKVILTREDPKEGLNPSSFRQSIRALDIAHETTLPEVLKEAKKSGLRFKKR